ncbi:MAG: type IV pilus biogenesis/stability protein PilW [Azoarcus sp.]|jgi:type IV pilus assembly protein PilF|nr:type IV pilus biogenesis/stability protein PilW [Azoarcus sp.]
MKRALALLCWTIPAFILGACATAPDAGKTNTFGVAPSYSGSYPRPMSDQQPATAADSKARVHTDLGAEYFRIGRLEVALDEARAALQIRPGYAPAYHLMGLVFTELDQNSQADDAFRAALREAPGDPDFNNSYGWFLCRQKRAAEAMPRFATATANPFYCCKTRPYTNAGYCLIDGKDYVGAERQFSKALEADPSNGDASFGLAQASYRSGNFRRAYDLLNQYHQRFGPSPRSALLGLCAARQLGERHAEASYTEQLRSRFANTPQNASMMQGKCE